MPQPLNSLKQICQQRAVWQAQGKRVVFTNGCFDLLHPGHITYLKDARALGDVLVIGLNDDASIRRLKGKKRPINPLQDRAVMLAALKSVSHVVAFSEDTPLNLIISMMPDVLVKGGDYQICDIVGADIVQAAGGQVTTIAFLDGYSSSRLIQHIKDL
ncbi:MAG: D-glycero-beta-D-manno-heptose 1-phosphate adenylyltransferase [Mariprofundaceae bacterium]|nr:D-glycero-beta-D-manno-heptose 1-phosphate adenylyltransferase [Mariprofundaceae bacterium]